MTPLEIIQGTDFKEIKKLFKRPVFKVEQQTAIDQYDVTEHDVYDATLRPKRKLKMDVVDENGQVTSQTEVLVDVVRVGIPWQKIITERRIGFTLTTPVTTQAIYDKETDKEKSLVKMVERIQHDNKMDYKNKEILRRILSEMECAVIWYYVETGEPKPKYTLKHKILATGLGDSLYPLFDDNGDMISFARGYKIKVEDKEIEHFDIYTPDLEYRWVSVGNDWQMDTLTNSDGTAKPNPIPNQARKLLIEYYSILQPVWSDVQSMISRHETLTSNHGGMNDKFGAPLLAVTGDIIKSETDSGQGNVIQMENGASADYVQLSSEPQSIKLEQENLEKFIYTMSQTPDISFGQMLSIGAMSGFAMTLLLSDPHMAVRCVEEWFGIGLQRRLNIIKHAIGALIDTSLANEAKVVQLKPVITPYMPKNVTELIENLSVAKASGIISTETSVEINPYVSDSEIELERMKNDKTAELAGTQ